MIELNARYYRMQYVLKISVKFSVRNEMRNLDIPKQCYLIWIQIGNVATNFFIAFFAAQIVLQSLMAFGILFQALLESLR